MGLQLQGVGAGNRQEWEVGSPFLVCAKPSHVTVTIYGRPDWYADTSSDHKLVLLCPNQV